MVNDDIVIDAVAHAYDFREENRLPTFPSDAYQSVAHWLYNLGHGPLESREGEYLLSFEEWTAGYDPEELLSMFFEESDVDVIVVHGVEFKSVFKNGPTSWEQCMALKRACPERVLVYAPCDPLCGPAELDRMQALVEECDVAGFKFYPANGVMGDGRQPLTFTFDDEAVYPYIERARSLGVKQIAIHKAVPAAPGGLTKDRPDDVASAAVAFPDMTFEIVHSGWAFLEECALLMDANPNIWGNLEAVSNFAVRQPRRFARAIGTLVRHGGEDRLVHGSGAPLAHPQPIVEAILNFEMPEDLLEEGLPEITPQFKRKFLGENMARLHHLDIDGIKCVSTTDGWSERRRQHVEAEQPPWRLHRDRLRAEAEVAVT
jgi:uncharacterized protein